MSGGDDLTTEQVENVVRGAAVVVLVLIVAAVVCVVLGVVHAWPWFLVAVIVWLVAVMCRAVGRGALAELTRRRQAEIVMRLAEQYRQTPPPYKGGPS